MLCTRSNHLPRDALHDLVTSEANSGSIQAFQEDILRTLIDNGAQDPKDQPRRHAPTIVGRSSALRQESPSVRSRSAASLRQRLTAVQQARKRSVSEESLRLPRGAATDDESSTDDDMQSAADLDKAVKIGASSTSLQDAIQRMTEWDAESDHEWRKLVDACRDARFSTLRRICNEVRETHRPTTTQPCLTGLRPRWVSRPTTPSTPTHSAPTSSTSTPAFPRACTTRPLISTSKRNRNVPGSREGSRASCIPFRLKRNLRTCKKGGRQVQPKGTPCAGGVFWGVDSE